MNADMGPAAGPDMATYSGIDINYRLGALFWGTLISMVLTGIAILQAYQYFPSKDRPLIQITAVSVLVLDLLSSALAAQGLYYYMIPHFGSTRFLNHLVPTLSAECVTTTCIIAITQFYFAWQLYVLSENRFTRYVIPGVVAFLSLVAFAGGLGCSSVMFLHPTRVLTNRTPIFSGMTALSRAPGALADIIATTVLCYTLGYARTGMNSTNSVIKTLIGFLVERCVLVTLVQIAFLILFFLSPPHMYWLGLHVSVTRVYANTFFAMLNGRDKLKEECRTRPFATSGLGTHNTSRLSRKGVDLEATAIESQQSMWMDKIKRRDSTDTMEITQIHVDRTVVVSSI